MKKKLYIVFCIIFLQSFVFSSSIQKISFEKEIKPILDKRCVVCHSCYNSPCQLKLSSLEGLLRGATKEEIYENRILPANPTRLLIDATNEKEWKDLGFYSVLKKIWFRIYYVKTTCSKTKKIQIVLVHMNLNKMNYNV